MRKILLATVCALTLISGVHSVKAETVDIPDSVAVSEPPASFYGPQIQEPRPMFKGMHDEKHGEKLSEELGLTAEQKAEAKKIREAGREDMKPLMEEMRSTREKMDAVRKKNMEEFEKILTPEQKEKFETFKFEKKGHKGVDGFRKHEKRGYKNKK